MAQTGFTPIQLYSTSTAAAAPVAGNLINSTLGSELAINITDGKLFYKDNSNVVQVIGWKTVPTTAGGTGLTTYTAGDMLFYTGGTALSQLAIGASGRYLSSTGGAPQWSAPAALTKTDDTNVTLTLGGSASTSLLNAASLTLGWTGTLAVGRGGTGTGTAFTAGSVVFAGTSGVYSQKNANFFWDNTNNRLGIGTTTPASILQLAASVPSLRITASGGADCEILSDGSNVYLGPTGAHNLRLQTNGSTRAMIHSSGGISLGNTTDPGAGNLALAAGKFIRLPSASTNFDLVGNAGGNDYLSINANGTQRHQFNDAGAAYNTTGTWGTISDVRLKENINDATTKLDDVLKLRVVNYNLKTDPDVKQIGFIAQEIEQVFPGLVEQGEPTEDGDFYKSVKTSVLIPILVKAMQEQQTQIDELKNQLTQLKGI
jgi:hypothetical protein